MDKVRIIDGLEITDISLGVEHLGVWEHKDECHALIEKYLAAGGNCLDTARLYAYGETDKVIGDWLKKTGRRNELVLSTKGNHNHLDDSPRVSPTLMEADLEDALRDLGIDHTDIHFLHRDNVNMRVEEIMPTVDKLVKSGKVRTFGCSNWTAARIAEANEFAQKNNLTPFSVSQIMYGLAITTPAATHDLTHVTMNDVEYGWYDETQFPLMAYSAQSRGYFSRFADGREQKESVARYYDRFPENRRRAERIVSLANELKTNVAAVGIAYVRDSSLNVSALCTMSKLEQFDTTFEALRFKLTAEQIEYLRSGEAISAPKSGEQTTEKEENTEHDG